MLAGITDWILSLHGSVALAIVFLLTALEASAFVGFVFPGEIAVVLGGVLASQHRGPLAAMIAVAVAGAIIGDTIGYAVGRRWGHQMLRGAGKHVPFIRHRIDEHLASARAFLRRHGGKAVFFGRFTAALRVMVPGLAGMAELPYGQFLLWNAIGGVVWGTGFVLLGYVAGNAWERVAGDASKIDLALLVLALVVIVLGRVLRNVRERGELLSDRLARLRAVAWFRSRFPSTSGWLAGRIDTGTPRGFVLTVVTLSGVICVWVFLALTQDVVAHEEAVASDPTVMRFMVEHSRLVGDGVDEGRDLAGVHRRPDPVGRRTRRVPGADETGVACGGRAGRGDHRRRCLALPRRVDGGATSSSRGVRARPGVRVFVPVGARDRRGGGVDLRRGRALVARSPWHWRVVGACVATVIVALVALSRLYLGVQWWTDVAGGLALGGAWVCLLVGGVLVVSSELPPRWPAGTPAAPSDVRAGASPTPRRADGSRS